MTQVLNTNTVQGDWNSRILSFILGKIQRPFLKQIDLSDKWGDTILIILHMFDVPTICLYLKQLLLFSSLHI